MTVAASSYDAIADATRRRILDMLRHGSQNAGAIARRFPGISRPAVSKHLAVLRRARLVVATKHGRQLRYSLNAAPLAEVDAWLRRYQAYWDQQLRSFKNHVESSESRKEDGPEQ
jgi:DNA-binding transcriptional ArsR family regulator